MKQIKSAYIFGVSLPYVVQDLIELVEKVDFQPPAPMSRSSSGFIKNPSTDELVTTLRTGWSLCLRTDEKILPNEVVNKIVGERIADIEEKQDRQVYRKERLQIRDDVIAELLPIAFIKTRHTHIYYCAAERLLIVGAGSSGAADNAIGMLREALGSLSAVALRIDELTYQLTYRINRLATGHGLDLGKFGLGNYLQLQGSDGQTLSFKENHSIEGNIQQVEEPLRQGYYVNEVALCGAGCYFKLKSDLSFRSLHFDEQGDEHEFEDVADLWRHEAAIQTLILCHQVKSLLELSGSLFPPPEEEQPPSNQE